MHDLYASGVDPARVLRPDEVEAVIAGSEWRTIPLVWAGANIWFGATPTGKSDVENAPEDIKRYWRGEGAITSLE
jgi:hypothetical protein